MFTLKPKPTFNLVQNIAQQLIAVTIVLSLSILKKRVDQNAQKQAQIYKYYVNIIRYKHNRAERTAGSKHRVEIKLAQNNLKAGLESFDQR
jgi:hypothetical protein